MTYDLIGIKFKTGLLLFYINSRAHTFREIICISLSLPIKGFYGKLAWSHW
jgi:hypothetical protein